VGTFVATVGSLVGVVVASVGSTVGRDVGALDGGLGDCDGAIVVGALVGRRVVGFLVGDSVMTQSPAQLGIFTVVRSWKARLVRMLE
jgi:hypothetical protein